MRKILEKASTVFDELIEIVDNGALCNNLSSHMIEEWGSDRSTRDILEKASTVFDELIEKVDNGAACNNLSSHMIEGCGNNRSTPWTLCTGHPNTSFAWHSLSNGKQCTSKAEDKRPLISCDISHKLFVEGSERYYVFRSGFIVLESSLKDEIVPYLNRTQEMRLRAVEDKIEEVERNKEKGMKKLLKELKKIIAKECPLTGSLMVRSVDKGFSDALLEDESFEEREW